MTAAEQVANLRATQSRIAQQLGDPALSAAERIALELQLREVSETLSRLVRLIGRFEQRKDVDLVRFVQHVADQGVATAGEALDGLRAFRDLMTRAPKMETAEAIEEGEGLLDRLLSLQNRAAGQGLEQLDIALGVLISRLKQWLEALRQTFIDPLWWLAVAALGATLAVALSPGGQVLVATSFPSALRMLGTTAGIVSGSTERTLIAALNKIPL